MKDLFDVAALLKEERLRQNINQVEISKRMGVSQQHVSNIELGKVKDFDILEKYASAINKHINFTITLTNR